MKEIRCFCGVITDFEQTEEYEERTCENCGGRVTNQDAGVEDE